MEKQLSSDPEVANKELTPEKAATPSGTDGNQETSELKALVAGYRKLYPSQKTFYVSSDEMVFFNQADANYHQSVVDGSKTVSTFKFK